MGESKRVQINVTFIPEKAERLGQLSELYGFGSKGRPQLIRMVVGSWLASLDGLTGARCYTCSQQGIKVPATRRLVFQDQDGELAAEFDLCAKCYAEKTNQ